MTDQDGEVFDARIIAIDAEKIRLDFNHPLAGKVLNFSVEVVDLRHASSEELAHGHVHEEGMVDDEEDLDEEYEEDLEEDEDFDEDFDEDEDFEDDDDDL